MSNGVKNELDTNRFMSNGRLPKRFFNMNFSEAKKIEPQNIKEAIKRTPRFF